MQSVWITGVAVKHPPHWITQAEAMSRIAAATGDRRRVAALGRGSQIERRYLAADLQTMGSLGTIESRNELYRQVAPGIALDAAQGVLGELPVRDIGQLVTTSCTGYMIPGWDVGLVEVLGLSRSASRVPLTQCGCAGGVVAIEQACQHAMTHPESRSLVVAAELCSLAFHARTEPGNLTAALIFGDGAAAAVIESRNTGPEPALEVIDSLSMLVPATEDALGFSLTDQGFYPLLTADLPELLVEPALCAAELLLARQEISLDDLAFWLVHPGGARILKGLEQRVDAEPGAMRWSWESLRDCGNMSSVSILDVMRRYLEDRDAPAGWGIAVAFGPGLSIEMLLVRRC